jgi:hypothetical protein
LDSTVNDLTQPAVVRVVATLSRQNTARDRRLSITNTMTKDVRKDVHKELRQ